MASKTESEAQQEREKLPQEQAAILEEHELRGQLSKFEANRVTPSSVTLLHDVTTPEHEQIHARAQLVCSVGNSQYDLNIGELAFELLLRRHREQHLANVEIKQRAMILVEEKLSLFAKELTAKHDKDITELEEARFILFEEFDARRAAWAAAVTTENMLVEEGSKHKELVVALVAQKQCDDATAQETLENTIKELRQDGVFAWEQQKRTYHLFYRKIDQAREEAAADRRERHRVHAERLNSLEEHWELRQIELKERDCLGKQERLARFKLEDEYQARITELAQGWNAVQQRQARELQALVQKRISARSAVVAAYEAAEAMLQDERRQVDVWWNQLIDEGTACRRPIDQDEERGQEDHILSSIIGLVEAAITEQPSKADPDVNAAVRCLQRPSFTPLSKEDAASAQVSDVEWGMSK